MYSVQLKLYIVQYTDRNIQSTVYREINMLCIVQFTILYCSLLYCSCVQRKGITELYSYLLWTVLQFTFIQLRGLSVSHFLYCPVLYLSSLYSIALPVVRATFEQYTVEWRGHITIITLHLIAQIAL